jgi:hypothetical protein
MGKLVLGRLTVFLRSISDFVISIDPYRKRPDFPAADRFWFGGLKPAAG